MILSPFSYRKCIASLFLALMPGIFCAQKNVFASDLTIDVKNGSFVLVPIGVIGFEGAGIGKDVTNVVINDLRMSGAFRMLENRGSQTINEAFKSPSLWEWRYTRGAVISCGIISDIGNLSASVKVCDVDSSRSKSFNISAPAGNWRLLAHRISNAIYKDSTGETGYFDTQIIYAAQRGSTTNKISQITIMDQDGKNSRVLTPASYMSLTPSFASDGKRVTFVSIKGKGEARIHIMDLMSGNDRILSIDGIAISPRFSPDNKSIIYGIAKNGTTSLSIYNIESGSKRKFHNPGGTIDVSPSFSPDGTRIIFSSDREFNRPKLYIMNVGSGAIRRIGSDVGSYHSPIYSPDGKWIAFIKRVRGLYYLGVSRSDGSEERLIISGHVIDYPSWAPNSGMIVCAIQDRGFGPFSIYSVNLSGRAMRKINPDKAGGANHPCWGPRHHSQ